MPIVKSFKGWRYNSSLVKDISKVVAPPYDVISPKQQQALYSNHPSNIIRLELGKDLNTDNAQENKYTRARRLIQEWMDNSTWRQDGEASFYVYEQHYKEGGKLQKRIGFLGAMLLDEKAVLKHENTLAGPKKDRLALIKEVRTNLSPIFGLFEDAKGSLQKILKKTTASKPQIDITVDGVRHRIFVIGDKRLVAKIEQGMKSKPMFIADGHHRFEVACQYKDWMKSKNGHAHAVQPSWGYVMTYFADVLHNPFKIFPTHRMIRVPSAIKNPIELLAGQGRLEKVSSLKAVLKKLDKTRQEIKSQAYSFGIYTRKDGFYILTLDAKIAKKHQKNIVDKLDVAMLHAALIAPLFKITKIEKSESIDFTRDAEAAYEKVKKGEFDTAFFLRPTSLKEMIDVSKKGLKMPQKSTYFYPKLLTGLVFHQLEGSQN